VGDLWIAARAPIIADVRLSVHIGFSGKVYPQVVSRFFE